MMRVAITAQGRTLDSPIDHRFGRCKYFIIVDLESLDYRAVENSAAAVGSGAGAPAAFLVYRQDVAAVLTNHLGPTAAEILASKGIQAFSGIAGSARQAIDQFREHSLQRIEKNSVPAGFGLVDEEHQSPLTAGTNSLKILDLFAVAELQSILQNIAGTYRTYTTLQDAHGTILLAGGEPNPLCTVIRSRPRLKATICGNSNQNIFREAVAMKDVNISFCEMGMYKIAVPIFHENTFVGGLSACGVADSTDPIDAFLLAKTLDISEERAQTAIDDVAVITADRARRLAAALQEGQQVAAGQRGAAAITLK